MRQFELKPPDRRHRHDDDDEIAYCVECSVCIPRRAKVEASPGLSPVPDFVYGLAFKHGGEGERG